MESRRFRVAECCLNCRHRRSRIRRNVFCDVDMEWRSERLICDRYVRSNDPILAAQEAKLLPEEAR